MYRATVIRRAMVSTSGGQRRILKQRKNAIEYLQNAVHSGIYRTDDELDDMLKERKGSHSDDLRIIMQRFRQDIVRGSHIMDYPDEYLILSQHPPIPDPPRIPKKLQRQENRLNKKESLLEKLTEKYLTRHDVKEKKADVLTGEEYYRRLLGVKEVDASSKHIGTDLKNRSAELQRAYAAAMKHHELRRDDGLSEKEAMEAVDKLLERTAHNESVQGAERTRKAKAWRTARNNESSPKPLSVSIEGSLDQERGSALRQTEVIQIDASQDVPAVDLLTLVGNRKKTSAADFENLSETLSSIFSTSPTAAAAMIRWSERLHSVPYVHWTIGASTALDHWIARQLLGFSEDTWLSALEGDLGVDSRLLEKGRHIVAVREVLFPETILEETNKTDNNEEKDADAFADEEILKNDPMNANEPAQEMEDTIENLLEKLGRMESTKPISGITTNVPASVLDPSDNDPEFEANDLDSKVQQLTKSLNDWRQKHVSEPYDGWLDCDQKEFQVFLRRYVRTLCNNADAVDLVSTREALLAQPPVAESESSEFWDQLSTEQQASRLLDSMLKDRTVGANILHAAFYDLDRDEQITRLLNLGAVRPLLDEYTKETDRRKFLARYGDTLLQGVPLDHLVHDDDGPIRSSDINEETMKSLNIESGARFRLERFAYRGTTEASIPPNEIAYALRGVEQAQGGPSPVRRRTICFWTSGTALHGRRRYCDTRRYQESQSRVRCQTPASAQDGGDQGEDAK